MAIQGKQNLIVEYGRKTLVFGMTWYTASGEESPRKDAAALARRIGSMDLMILRTDDKPQYALAAKRDGIKPGMVSAAAVVARMVSAENWLYVLEIQDSTWICYGNDGQIMSGGDTVYSNREEAYQQFVDLDPARWKSLHVPASWKQMDLPESSKTRFLINDETNESSIEDIGFQRVEKWMRAVPISPFGAVIKLGGAATAIALASFGITWLMTPSAPNPGTPSIDDQRALIAQQAIREKALKFEEFDADKPWAAIPSPDVFYRSCEPAMSAAPIFAIGYQASSIECSEASVSVTLDKGEDAFSTWLTEWVANRPEYQVSTSEDGAQAFLVTTTDAPPSRGDQKLSNFLVISNTINQVSEITRSEVSISTPVVYQYEDYPEYVPIYGTSDLLITTTVPSAWIGATSRIPGIAITKMTLRIDDMTYTLEGKIYVSNR